MAVATSTHLTLIRSTLWHARPLDARGLACLSFFVAHVLVGLGAMGWTLWSLRESVACERRWRLRQVRWDVQSRA